MEPVVNPHAGPRSAAAEEARATTSFKSSTITRQFCAFVNPKFCSWFRDRDVHIQSFPHGSYKGNESSVQHHL